MRSIAVFNWKGKLPSDEEVGADPATRYSNDFGEQWALQSCAPIASQLFEAVQKTGHFCDTDAPYAGETGWHFIVRDHGRAYSIFVQWIGIQENDTFAVQVSLRRGCLTSIFMRRPNEDAVEPACRILDLAFANLPDVNGLRWLTENQFNAIL